MNSASGAANCNTCRVTLNTGSPVGSMVMTMPAPEAAAVDGIGDWDAKPGGSSA